MSVSASSRGLKCFYTNSRSLRNKVDELHSYMIDEDLDIVCITESWVNEKMFLDNLAEFKFPNYDLFTYQRKDKKGGGIAMYVKTALKACDVFNIKSSVDVESLWLDVYLNANCTEKLRLGAFYRPPGQGHDIDQAIVDEIESGLTKSTIILGDFNIPKLQADITVCSDYATKLLRAAFEENFLVQLVKEPTRKSEILDLILTNKEEAISDVRVGEALGESDHNIIRFTIRKDFKRLRNNTTLIPNFNKGDFDGMRAYVGNIDWATCFKGENAFGMWNILKDILMRAHNQFIPLRQLRNRKKLKPPWFGTEVQNGIREKRSAFLRFKASPNVVNENAYRETRHLVKKIIRRSKRQSEIEFSKNCGSNIKRFFSFYKFKRKSNTVGPFKVNGQLVFTDLENVELLSKQFSSVFTHECDTNIPLIDKMSGITRLSEIYITEKDIKEELLRLGENKSSGPDDISARVLKELYRELILPLKLIFERSLYYTEIPQDWKNANVVPIFKGGDKHVTINYRPISLTSLVCKLLERLIKAGISTHLENQILLQSSQHGFRCGRSCLTNLLDFFEYTTDQVDKGKKLSVVYLDFCKAFDKVPHKRLLIKLAQHGIDGLLLKWISDWLAHRKQRVILNGVRSSWAKVLSGVPQGSVLGPLLFIIFVNDIENGLSSRVWKFADDIKLAKVIDGFDDEEDMQSDLNKILEWTKTWQMSLNISKCKTLNVGPGLDCSFGLGGDNIQNITYEKDLGVIVAHDMKSSLQTQEARKRALKMLGILNRNVNYKSKAIMKRLYYAFVRPHLEYCLQSWRPVHKKDLKALENVQRKATKMIQGLHHLSYEDRLKALNMHSFQYRGLRGDMSELFKIITRPDNMGFDKMFKLNRNSTRGHKFKLQKQHVRTLIRKNFFSQRVVDTWNSLSDHVVSSSSLHVFKKRLDEHFKDSGKHYCSH